jgi:alpha-tubulin suppressor-like RCC1 family protein
MPNNARRSSPLSIRGDDSCNTVPLKDIIAISAGNYHVLALDKYGNVWAWGYNNEGQLGDGSLAESPIPVRVEKIRAGYGYLTNIIYIDAGFDYSTAIDSFGNFWVWGYNNNGQLGLGDTSDRLYATQMP